VTFPTPPSRAVDEVVGPYANFLVSVPARTAPDTCPTCHSVVYDGWTRCYACHQAAQTLGAGVADVTAFVSLTPAGEQLARELYTYKRGTVPAHLREQRLVGLAAVLWKWLSLHEACVAAPLNAGSFDVVTTVPSASGRPGEHPLRRLVSGVVSGTMNRYVDLLTSHARISTSEPRRRIGSRQPEPSPVNEYSSSTTPGPPAPTHSPPVARSRPRAPREWPWSRSGAGSTPNGEPTLPGSLENAHPGGDGTAAAWMTQVGVCLGHRRRCADPECRRSGCRRCRHRPGGG
jgi:hypothetical protein